MDIENENWGNQERQEVVAQLMLQWIMEKRKNMWQHNIVVFPQTLYKDKDIF